MSHYNKKYFLWHRSIGEFGGWANLIKFEKYIEPKHSVLDFGSGGGYLLENLTCTNKLGVEINSEAVKEAKKRGIKTYTSPKSVEDNWADVIISNNTLEHVPSPLETLKTLYNKLRPGGKIVFVVPCERNLGDYYPGDINQHIYSWNPLLLGNLFTCAGFKVVESKPFYHKWPLFYPQLHRILGNALFHAVCHINGRLDKRLVQVRIIAKKQ